MSDTRSEPREVVNPFDLAIALNELSEVDLVAMYELSAREIDRRMNQRKAERAHCYPSPSLVQWHLFHDREQLLNRPHNVTPIGAYTRV